MLTFEKVLTAFNDYLTQDKRYEVVMTSRGYTVMEWDSAIEDWTEVWFCPTPEKMKGTLLDAMAGYLEYNITLSCRALTETECQEIQTKLHAILDRLR